MCSSLIMPASSLADRFDFIMKKWGDRTALHLVACEGRVEAVRLLLAANSIGAILRGRPVPTTTNVSVSAPSSLVWPSCAIAGCHRTAIRAVDARNQNFMIPPERNQLTRVTCRDPTLRVQRRVGTGRCRICTGVGTTRQTADKRDISLLVSGRAELFPGVDNDPPTQMDGWPGLSVHP